MTQRKRSLLLVVGNLKNPNPRYNRSKTTETDAKIDQEFNTLTKNGFPTSKIHKDFTLQKKNISWYELSQTENARLLSVLLYYKVIPQQFVFRKFFLIDRDQDCHTSFPVCSPIDLRFFSSLRVPL